MKTFKDLVFGVRFSGLAGVDAKYEYPNGYTASVVRGLYTYGSDEGLYEVAVMRDGDCVYDTSVTDDVIGYCSEDKVTNIMQQIESLPMPGDKK